MIARWAAIGVGLVAALVTAIVLLSQPHHQVPRYADYLKTGTTSSQCPVQRSGGWTCYEPLSGPVSSVP